MGDERYVKIRCDLPSGLTIETGTPGHGPQDKDPYAFYQINGLSKARRGAKFVDTDVPADVWASWLKRNAKSRLVVGRSVFEVPQ